MKTVGVGNTAVRFPRRRIGRWGGLVFACLAAGLLAVWPARAQVSPALYDYARPTLRWYTIETPHFNIVFHADSAGTGSNRTAQAVARIAEDIYGPITSLYGYEPDTRVTFVLKDYEDYSNGAAYFFDNMIEIWAPALDSPLRGDHNWLRNVITHEYTHMVQVQKTMKQNRRVPFYYLQWLHYEDVKRPDVLYGYPNGIVTYPVPVLSNPAWLAEGTAQYQRAGLAYDTWDSHRDMLLRTRVLAGRELSLAEMGGFYSHTSLMREGVYNHGYAFTRYIARTYGEDALRKISDRLGSWGNWNVERAMADALGVPGGRVYDDWMTALRREYQARTEAIRQHAVEGRLVEPEGFLNFYPRFSPDGTRLAYVSNRGEDFSRTSLYVRDLATGALVAHALSGEPGGTATYTCAQGHRLRSDVGDMISWRPDGGAIVYSQTRDNRYGYLYADLYEFDLTRRKARRLTRDRRAVSPAFAPDGRSIAYVSQRDGTTNLFVLDPATGAATPATRFDDGGQVSDPAWHPTGEWIYFARSDARGRDLYRVRADGSGLEPVLQSPADERSPAFDPAGRYLYYASDASGIFNLYRQPLDRPGAAPEQVTQVVGGAFMPAVAADGRVAFARYQWDGYKVALLDASTPLPAPDRLVAYTPPALLDKPSVVADEAVQWAHLNGLDDTDIRSLGSDAFAVVEREGSLPLPATNGHDAEAAPLQVEPYSNVFTSFSFYPVFRLDQYVGRTQARLDGTIARRSTGEMLARNVKVGAYVSSREVLGGLSFFGGALVGPGSVEAGSLSGYFAPSTVLKMERDVFVQFDYNRGLPFIPYRWSPQLSFELFNIRRNVDSGLSIEEFPCTACFPDTTYADLSYNLWEANLSVRSKINRVLLLEAGYRYSPYRVTTERFFSRESNQFIDASSSRYYIGKAARLKAYFEGLHRHRDDDVVPEGLRAEATYEFEPGRLLDRFDVEDGLLVPEYEQFHNHRLTLDTRLGLRLPGRPGGGAHGVGFRARASTILGGPVDDFFHDYAGGLVGARGYPFYALGGNETLWLQASYQFPILPRIGRQALFTYFDKVYGRVYADAAAAWSGAWPGMGAVRKDVGAEIRLGLGSFYLLPTAIFASATYGFDAFDFQLDEGYVTPEGKTSVHYGQEVLWHFGLLFSFDL